MAINVVIIIFKMIKLPAVLKIKNVRISSQLINMIKQNMSNSNIRVAKFFWRS